MDDRRRYCLFSFFISRLDSARGRLCSSIVVLFVCSAAFGQASTNQPQIGYLYPAGGQRGTVVQVTAGGQFLRGATEVYISGEGVHAKVVKYIRPLRNIQKEQRDLILERLREVRDKRLAELPGSVRNSASLISRARRPASPGGLRRATAKRNVDGKTETTKDEGRKKPKVTMPEHPLLEDLDHKSLRELAHIASMLFFPRNKLQMNRQLAEMVIIEVTIDPDAVPGHRELRLGTRAGLTNPVVFQVGTLPEVRELEPNDEQAYPDLSNLLRLTGRIQGGTSTGARLSDRGARDAKPLRLPVLLNGQIMPGDVDRFRFRAVKGQRLVIQAHARSLIPYLADAVPGWFQATLALYDSDGKEVAYADDYRFDPDPVLFYRIAETGEYELEIRDSIYRGREDFIYRIAVGEQPFITQMFPLGGKAGSETVATITGWNLPEERLSLDTRSDGDTIRRAVYYDGKQASNSMPYAVDTLPECNESESNNTTTEAQWIDLPKIVNGRISESNDVDVFRFEGHAGQRIVAEVNARRLNSPLDSLLRLTDASGRVLEWNDDHVIEENHLYMNMAGLMTHHADSYLMAELPKDGTYYVHLSDSQRHGGEAYGYRLRLARAEGDFALRVTPSSLTVRAGQIVPIHIHALRKDGYDGPIDVVVKSPSGFKIDGGRIPAGCDHVRMTLTAPLKAPGRPVDLKLEGQARIGGKTIRRTVAGADDVMQAFLYRHLVPSQEFLVVVQNARWGAPPVELAGASPVRIPLGGSTRVLLKTRRNRNVQQMKLQLSEPPEGVTLDDVAVVPEGLALRLKADKDLVRNGFADNLIVEAFREFTPKQQEGKPAPPKRRSLMGIFPAIPIEVVSQ